MTVYLAKLNPEQRRAVEHGVGAPDDRPLLVIAGAGSGKTNTLAHRVAHLIVNGVDPRRLLLMTFSRRAAAEMERRVQRIVAAGGGAALPAAAPPPAGKLPFARRARRRSRLPPSPGREHSIRSARGCCASLPSASGLRRPSPFTTALIPPT